jgi:hypothetical protein
LHGDFFPVIPFPFQIIGGILSFDPTRRNPGNACIWELFGSPGKRDINPGTLPSPVPFIGRTGGNFQGALLAVILNGGCFGDFHIRRLAGFEGNWNLFLYRECSLEVVD